MIKELIGKLSERGEQVYSLPGKVISVDESERTCDVKPSNGDAEILGVRLQANIDLEHGWVLIPKEGSDVIVTFLSEETGFVSVATEVEKITLNIENQSFKLDSKGMQLASEKSDLKSELNDLTDVISGLCDILTTFQLSTNVGVTIAVLPHIVAKLQKVKTEVGVIQTNLNTFLQ